MVMNKKRITLQDVAKATGYSINTISHALKNKPDIAPATREKIQQVAREMGYIRNSLASTLRSGKSHTIAVIVNDLHNLHFCNMLSKMDAELRNAGYNMMILCMQLNEALGEQLIHTAISQAVDGILYFPYHNNRRHTHDSHRHQTGGGSVVPGSPQPGEITEHKAQECGDHADEHGILENVRPLLVPVLQAGHAL